MFWPRAKRAAHPELDVWFQRYPTQWWLKESSRQRSASASELTSNSTNIQAALTRTACSCTSLLSFSLAATYDDNKPNACSWRITGAA
jgi:hypothetical protein